MVVMILNLLYLYFRMASGLYYLRPIKLFARIINGLCNLKGLDTTTRAWAIGILALCLLAMGSVFYVGFQSATGVAAYVIVTGAFTLISIVFLFVVGKKTDR